MLAIQSCSAFFGTSITTSEKSFLLRVDTTAPAEKTAQIKIQQEVIYEARNISFEIFNKQSCIQYPEWSIGIHNTAE